MTGTESHTGVTQTPGSHGPLGTGGTLFLYGLIVFLSSAVVMILVDAA